MWHSRYRSVDGYNIYGDRSKIAYVSHPDAPKITNTQIMMEEMAQRDVMTTNLVTLLPLGRAVDGARLLVHEVLPLLRRTRPEVEVHLIGRTGPDVEALAGPGVRVLGEGKKTLNVHGERIAHLGTWEYHVATQETHWSEEEYRIYGLDPANGSPVYQDMLFKINLKPNIRVVKELPVAALIEESGMTVSGRGR